MIDTPDNGYNAPKGWDEYALLLKNQPAPRLDEQSANALMGRIDASIAHAPAQRRLVRWVAAPAVAVVTLLGVIVFESMMPIGDASEQTAPTGAASVLSKENPRAQRRARRRPQMTTAPLVEPPTIDTPTVYPVMPDPMPHVPVVTGEPRNATTGP